MTEEPVGEMVPAAREDLPRPPVEDYNAFVQDAQLDTIEVHRVEAEKSASGIYDHASIEFETEFAQGVAGQALYRFRIDVELQDGDGSKLGKIGVDVVATFKHSRDSVRDDVVARFGMTTATTLAYPYVRETVQSVANRMGFVGVVLPLIKLK